MTVVEYVAAAFGILGTLLLAWNGKHAGWGFVAFLASNAGWITFAIANDHHGLLLQQIAFTGTSIVGIYRWFDWRQLMCSHRFDLADLDRITQTLVCCPCHKCDGVFYATHGLALPGVFDRNSNARRRGAAGATEKKADHADQA